VKPVANSSVLIALAAIDRLDLLTRRFPDGVLVPRAVWREVVETGHGRPGATAVQAAQWITVCDTPPSSTLDLLRTELDDGEAEAIALALVDETEARRAANRLGLSVLGTVGILIWGCRAGLLPCLRSALDDLVGRGQFHLGSDVYANALRAVDEIPPSAAGLKP
jgi:hypothetical protein